MPYIEAHYHLNCTPGGGQGLAPALNTFGMTSQQYDDPGLGDQQRDFGSKPDTFFGKAYGGQGGHGGPRPDQGSGQYGAPYGNQYGGSSSGQYGGFS